MMRWFKRSQKSLSKSLLKAARGHKYAKAKELLNKGADINARDASGNTVLHALCTSLPTDHSGAGINITDKDGLTDFICLLVNNRFDMNAVNDKGETALHIAACLKPKQYHWAIKELIDLLTQYGVKMDHQDRLGRTAMHFVVCRPHDDRIIDRFESLYMVADRAGKYPHDYAMETGNHLLGNKFKRMVDSWLEQQARNRQWEEKMRLERVQDEGRRLRAVKEALEKAPIVTNPVAAPKPAKPAPVPAAVKAWHLSSPKEVICITDQPALGFRVTEVFNFYTRIYQHVWHGGEAKADNVTLKGFDDFVDKTLFRDALDRLRELGGTAEESSIEGNTLEKAPLKPALPRK